jgi:hypothetical protein
MPVVEPGPGPKNPDRQEPGISADRREQDHHPGTFGVPEIGFRLMSPEILVKNRCYYDVF